MKLIFAALVLSACSGVVLAADKSDYNYWTDSSPKPVWMPTSIKTNGGKTYIQFPDAKLLAAPKPGETSKAPELFLMPTTQTKQDEPVTVQYRVIAEGQYEVDSVIENAVLIDPNGPTSGRVLIQRKAASTTSTN